MLHLTHIPCTNKNDCVQNDKFNKKKTFPNVTFLFPLLRKANTHKLQHVPVKDVIIGKALSVEKVPEELPQIGVIRLIVKPQRATQGERGGRMRSLPRQRTQVEVHENVTQRLQVVSPRLLCGQKGRRGTSEEEKGAL
uniref:Uncharacterized protein n=1 Tax=Cyprinodon variegatus TaxID=28743 RepID=A0A3Q2GS05_CYPVA